MKRILVFLCLLLVLTLPVSAASQQVTLTEFDGTTMLKTEGVTMFEVPELLAGEQLTTPETLTLTNHSASEQRFVLEYVELPFENENSLAYLDYITVTVRQDNRVLYDGPYTYINDADGGLSIDCLLAANESVTFTVDMKADFRLPDKLTGLAADERIAWRFVNVVQTPAEGLENIDEAFENSSLREILIAAGIAVLLLAGVGVYEILRRRFGKRSW